QRFGFVGIDAQDARVGIGSAQRAGVQHTWEVVIVGIHGPPGHFVARFLAGDGLPDDLQIGVIGLRHGRRDWPLATLLLRCRTDSSKHTGIARAAAVGIFERNLYVLVRRVRLVVEQRTRRHDQSRRTESALHRAM